MRGIQAASGIGLLVLLLGVSLPAGASVFYEYTGNAFDAFDNSGEPPTGATYSASNRVSITLEFADPFAAGFSSADVRALVLSYTISDGARTIDDAGSALIDPLPFAVDGSGAVVRWSVVAESPDPESLAGQQSRIESRRELSGDGRDEGKLSECWNFSATFGCSVRSDSGSRQGAPGSWTLVPEPGTASLLGLGLVALRLVGARPAGRRRRSRRS